MKIEFPFNYRIYVGYRPGASSDENYREVAKVEVPEYARSDLTPAFSVGRAGVYGQANTPGAILHRDGQFLVPLSTSRSTWDPETHATSYHDIPWSADTLRGDADAEQVQATLSAFLHRERGKMAATTSEHRLSDQAFDSEVKPRRGRPDARRVRSFGSDAAEHPADIERERMESILGTSLALVDGNFHLVTREPRFEITEVERQGSRFAAVDQDVRQGLVCRLAAAESVHGLHVYRLDELPTVLDRMKAEGRAVRVIDEVREVDPSLFRERYEETRIVGALKGGFAHLSPRAHRLDRQQLERFIDARSLVLRDSRSREEEIPSPDFQDIARRVSTIRDLIDESGLKNDLPEGMSVSDLDQAGQDFVMSRDFAPEIAGEDLDALLPPPSMR